MPDRIEDSGQSLDKRPLNVEDLLNALNRKFTSNLLASTKHAERISEAERMARRTFRAGQRLTEIARDTKHQSGLAACLDEVFADSICAIYLACCGMDVPARMLLRRCTELSLVVPAYWDDPVRYWEWKAHDGDISFASLCQYLQSAAYGSLLDDQGSQIAIDRESIFKSLLGLYSELSNVVHPKTYNFATANAASFEPDPVRIDQTLKLAIKIHTLVSEVLTARFTELVPILMESHVQVGGQHG